MRFILYARASTKDKQHPEHQLAELRTEAARRGWEVVNSYVELESGKRDDRPILTACLDRVLRGEADGIAAVELSRIGRSLPHLLKIADALNLKGRHLVCTRQPIDTTTPIGRLVYAVLGAVAAFEAEAIRERVIAGVRHKRGQNGGSWGRAREVLPSVVLQMVGGWRASGATWRDCSDQLTALGYKQPARAGGRSAHPARPWPVGTLRDALGRVELPPSKEG